MIVQSVNQNWEQALISLARQASGVYNPVDQSLNQAPDRQTLRNAYAHCARITVRYSHSFHLATSLLPRTKRQSVRALYAFCRLVDDLVDGKHLQPKQALDQLRERLSIPITLQDMRDPTSEILLAWAETCTAYHIPHIFIDQLLDGVERDLYQSRYATFEDLAVYCYRVASTVGLMSMHIIGFDPAAIPYAIKMGVALQLTNILRDLWEDWQMGRLYLPQNELAAFGLEEKYITGQHVDESWRAFMHYQIARARQLYAEASPGIEFLNVDGQLAVSAAAKLYEGILDDIEAHNYDVFSRRAFVSDRKKIKLLSGIIVKFVINKL